MSRSTVTRLLCAVAVLSFPTVVTARGAKLDRSLRESVERGCAGAQSVIIRTTAGNREALRNALSSQGRRVKGEFPALDAIAADVSCADLEALSGFGGTSSISGNVSVETHQTDSTQRARLAEARVAQDLQSNLMATLALKQPAFGSLPGASAGVGVAVIDSGIEPGLDFGHRITAFYDFTNGDIRATAPSDQHGHGTHIAGLIGSRYVGVAPNARLIGLKVLDAEGQGTTDNVIRAIEFAIVNRRALDISVLNLSLGHPIFEPAATDPLVQAVEHAVREGLIVVVSAGNFGRNPQSGVVGYAGIASPGNAPSAFTVGSVRTFDTVSREDDRIAVL